MTKIRLTDIQPAPQDDPRRSAIGDERYNLLWNAATAFGFMKHWDKPEDIEIDIVDLPRLREAIDVKGRERRQKHIGVSGPFTDRSGYQWRSMASYRAPVRKTLLVRVDRVMARYGVAADD